MKPVMFLIFTLLWAQSALAQWEYFPALYDVQNVAQDDVLNLREGPSASYPLSSTLAYNERGAEVVRLSEDGKWGLVGLGENSAWASMRYLNRQPNQQGTKIPRPLGCFGVEPFVGIEFDQQGNQFSGMDGPPRALEIIWQQNPIGRGASSYGLKLAAQDIEISAVISRNICWGGMSNREYGFEFFLLVTEPMGTRMFNGCCRLHDSEF